MHKPKFQLIPGGKMSEVAVQNAVVVSKSLTPSQFRTWSEDEFKLLKETFCKGATDSEFKIFCYAIVRTGLDPFMRQIHAVKRWNSKKQIEEMAIQVGIDGYRLIAERTGCYAGSDEYKFDNEDEPLRCTVTVYKMVQGQKCAFSATARWKEYYPGDKQGFMWRKMPCVMLGKVAEALALRKAFPAELSGIYTNEEMDQAGPGHEISEWRITKEQRSLLFQAMTDNGYSLQDLRTFTARYKGGEPNSLEEYQETLFAMSQTKPKVHLVTDNPEKDMTAEIARLAKEEAVKAFNESLAEIERKRLQDIESQRFNHSRA